MYRPKMSLMAGQNLQTTAKDYLANAKEAKGASIAHSQPIKWLLLAILLNTVWNDVSRQARIKGYIS